MENMQVSLEKKVSLSLHLVYITLGTLGDPGTFNRIDAGCFGKPCPPRHTVWHVDSGFFNKKSKFREDMSNKQIEDAIADAICYPTYEFMAYQIKDSYNKGYRIYKR